MFAVYPREPAREPRFRRSTTSLRCAREDSNLRPRAPEARALSPELRARMLQCSLTRVQVEARIVTLELAETFVISRGAQATPRTSCRSSSARRAASRPRRSGADRPLRRVGGVGARILEEQRTRSATIPSRSRRSWRACRASSSRRGRRSTPRCTTSGEARRPAGLPAARPPARRPADVVDDLARRPRRHGAARGAGARTLPPPEAEARRRATASTSSACAQSARSPTCRFRST